jgi:primosomal protein N' (replication factor Y)
MDSSKFADVAVDAAVGHVRTFSYNIPPRLSVQPGQLVWVPFGRQVLQGVVIDLSPVSPVAATRDILQAVEPAPLLGQVQLELGRWLSRYYRCSLFTALSTLLPPGFEGQVRSRLTAVPGGDTSGLGPAVASAVAVLSGKSYLSERDFLQLLGRNGNREINRLVEKGVVHRKVTMPRPRVAPRYEAFLLPPRPSLDDSEARDDLTPRQKSLLTAVRTHSEPYPAGLANKEFGSGVGQALFDKGLVGMEWQRVSGGPEPRPDSQLESRRAKLTLTPEQANALAEIEPALDSPTHQPRSFLLHGVTGSGKTEIYLRSIDRVVRRGQQAIFLVPEISLTPQTLERVNAWFPGRVALLHSRLTPRQQFDQWWDILEGKCDVVVGPRSALFAPVDNLGLIVIDEEHEWTYKQVETHPLYHARTAAMELSRLTGAPVVMGSATPDVETYYQATRGRHRLLELPRRVSRAGSNGVARLGPELTPGLAPGLASVEVCDMRVELREGNREIFSRKLAAGLKDCVARGQQAILFLNRRGAASIVQCRDCGYVVTCRRCSVSLTYHLPQGRLLCHRCNGRSAMPRRCQRCSSDQIRQLGVGTQRVVEDVTKLLPGVRIDRLDADATRSGQSLELAMQRLASGETQVLVGTQMVAKGLDVPNVTLVGVVLADIGLFLPDFRAGERIFGLLCQVAGRAGRGAAPGQVYVQTYNPDHYAIQAAAAQDYAAMYGMEIESRREMGNPPFNQMVHLVYQDVDSRSGQRQALAASRELTRRADARGLTDVEVVGPAPGMPERLRGRYRWHLLLRGLALSEILEGMDFPPGCTVDVDPVHVL